MTAALMSLPLIVVLATTSPAAVPDRVEEITGEYLRLTSISQPESQQGMRPGDTARWVIGVRAEDPPVSEEQIDIELSAAGELPLTVDINVCDQPLTGQTLRESSCEGLSTQVKTDHRLNLHGEHLEIASFNPDQQRWITIDVTFPGAGGITPGTTTNIYLKANLGLETVGVSPDLGSEDPDIPGKNDDAHLEEPTPADAEGPGINTPEETDSTADASDTSGAGGSDKPNETSAGAGENSRPKVIDGAVYTPGSEASTPQALGRSTSMDQAAGVDEPGPGIPRDAGTDLATTGATTIGLAALATAIAIIGGALKRRSARVRASG